MKQGHFIHKQGEKEMISDKALMFCEKYGIYEIYSEKGNIITYYSYFGSEGFYRISINLKTGKETRKNLRYKKVPKFLKSDLGTKYNYFVG